MLSPPKSLSVKLAFNTTEARRRETFSAKVLRVSGAEISSGQNFWRLAKGFSNQLLENNASICEELLRISRIKW
jgi:hypothetical protein